MGMTKAGERPWSILWVPVLLLIAGQALAAGPDEASLRYYPSVERVRADVEATRRDDRPGESAGRLSGQYLLLAEVLESSWGGKYGPQSFENQAPEQAKRLRQQYLEASGTGRLPALQSECSGLTVEEQTALGICARVNYVSAQTRQRLDFEQVRQVALRYFPPDYQAAFVKHSPAQEVDEYKDEQARQQEQKRQLAEAQERRERKEAMARRLVAGVLLGMLLIPLVLLALMIRHARTHRGRNDSLTRILSAEDLHLFVTSGQAVDVQRHSRTHVTTTTENRYIHPDSYESRAPVTSTTFSTTDHLTVFLKTDEGGEVQESFVNLAAAVRPGNRISIVYGGDRWSRSGVAVAVVNRDTRDVAVDTVQARRLASRFPLLRAAFWGLAIAAAGTALDLALGLFTFTLPAWALGMATTLFLAFLWQHALWAAIRGQVQSFANRVAHQDP